MSWVNFDSIAKNKSGCMVDTIEPITVERQLHQCNTCPADANSITQLTVVDVSHHHTSQSNYFWLIITYLHLITN